MLTVANVDAGYGESQVLRDVTVVIPDGCVVSLLGPNGAGKTTLLRTISGLLRPSAGRVLFDDVDISDEPPYIRAARGLCHVPEGRGIFRSLTVRENLVCQAGSTNVRDAIDRATEAFPILGERLSQIAGTLSGGEQQMLALARAYITDPPLVLLDEVSTGLAPVVVAEIFAFIEKLASRGRSLLLVEQYVTKALAISDYVYLLNKGQVSFAGEPGELADEQVFESYIGVRR